LNKTFNETIGNLQVLVIKAGSWAISLFVVAIYFSTSLAIILSGLLGLLWLFSGQYKTLPEMLKNNWVAASSLLLFAFFMVGLSYSSVSNIEALSMLSKYRELLFIPLLTVFLSTERTRYWAWNAFIISSVLILVISYLMHFGILNLNHQGDPAFKSRITHSIFISFFGFFCAHKAYDGKAYQKLYWLLFIACAYNLFFIVEGRTGQLIAVSLVLLFAVQRFTKQGLVMTALVVGILMLLFLNYSDKATRFNEGVVNMQSDLKPGPEQSQTSMGQRYMFWRYTLKLIAEKPLFGHGTGSFAKEYERIASSETMMAKNPHNEFLMVSVQLGVVGLVIYLGFLASQYYLSKRLPHQEKYVAQGLLLTLIITSLFNTPIMDHAEGHWFVMIIALCYASLSTGLNTEINHA
jgi:O-antigen ligase